MSFFNRDRRSSNAWVLTFTGRRVYVLDPSPTDYCIRDIAHGLAIESRWGSQAPEPYSVAQHSLLVVRILEQMLAQTDPLTLLCGLLHDASESVLKDLPRPLKYALPSYRKIERRHEAAIAARFGLPVNMPAVIKEADRRAAATERRDLFPLQERRKRLSAEPYLVKTRAWGWRRAEREFLTEYANLFARMGGGRAACRVVPPPPANPQFLPHLVPAAARASGR